MKVVFDENVFDEIDHFHPNFDESVPNRVFLLLYTTLDLRSEHLTSVSCLLGDCNSLLLSRVVFIQREREKELVNSSRA